MRTAKAFTLVEILIVVVLLGILAAVVIPSIARSGSTAREGALACDVGLLRRFILIYKSHHLEVAPGYPNGNESAQPTGDVFMEQATLSSNAFGRTAAVGTPGYPFGPYLSRLPFNPLNNLSTIQMVSNDNPFPSAPDSSHGWICKPQTGEIRPDCPGENDRGIAYYDY
jgi:prepilin-type N-terminal cleavage/methylation domain-containing protein